MTLKTAVYLNTFSPFQLISFLHIHVIIIAIISINIQSKQISGGCGTVSEPGHWAQKCQSSVVLVVLVVLLCTHKRDSDKNTPQQEHTERENRPIRRMQMSSNATSGQVSATVSVDKRGGGGKRAIGSVKVRGQFKVNSDTDRVCLSLDALRSRKLCADNQMSLHQKVLACGRDDGRRRWWWWDVWISGSHLPSALPFSTIVFVTCIVICYTTTAMKTHDGDDLWWWLRWWPHWPVAAVLCPTASANIICQRIPMSDIELNF